MIEIIITARSVVSIKRIRGTTNARHGLIGREELEKMKHDSFPTSLPFQWSLKESNWTGLNGIQRSCGPTNDDDESVSGSGLVIIIGIHVILEP